LTASLEHLDGSLNTSTAPDSSLNTSTAALTDTSTAAFNTSTAASTPRQQPQHFDGGLTP
jgi:hypothetical protein